MTTANSSLHRLKEQADKIAAALKAAERGEAIANDPPGMIAAAGTRDGVTFCIVMDDKIIEIEMPWSVIGETPEAGISEYIVGQMRDRKATVQ